MHFISNEFLKKYICAYTVVTMYCEGAGRWLHFVK